MSLNSEKKLDIEKTWIKITADAKKIVKVEPWVEPMVRQKILNRKNMADCLAYVLSSQLNNSNVDSLDLRDLFNEVLEKRPQIVYDAVIDIKATFDRDPACTSYLEPLMFFKGYLAIETYRIAHFLWNTDRKFLAKFLQSACSRNYEVDIHPAAVIGNGILFDHSTNIVIGETAKVGSNVSILHGVTLGGTGKEHEDRHPKVSDGVMIGAHAQLLGNIKIGRGAKIGAGAVVLSDVRPHTTAAGVPACNVGTPRDDMPSLHMDQNFISSAESSGGNCVPCDNQ